MLRVILVFLLFFISSSSVQNIERKSVDDLCDRYVPDDPKTCKADIRRLASVAMDFYTEEDPDKSLVAYRYYQERVKAFQKKYPLALILGLDSVDAKDL